MLLKGANLVNFIDVGSIEVDISLVPVSFDLLRHLADSIPLSTLVYYQCRLT